MKKGFERMAVCGSCARQLDRGKTVGGALESAKNYVSKGSLDNAKQEYNFALRVLKESGGCSSCIREIIRLQNMNT